MNSKPSTMKSVMLIAALVASVSGLVHADGNSMNPYNVDSYAYFNGGNLSQGGNPVIDKAPSTFHKDNPHGLPFSYYGALADPDAPEWQPALVIDKTPSTFHKDNPHGLPLNTYAALAEPDAPQWQPAPVIDKTPSSFHKDFPHGLPLSFYAAFSDH